MGADQCPPLAATPTASSCCHRAGRLPLDVPGDRTLASFDDINVRLPRDCTRGVNFRGVIAFLIPVLSLGRLTRLPRGPRVPVFLSGLSPGPRGVRPNDPW